MLHSYISHDQTRLQGNVGGGELRVSPTSIFTTLSVVKLPKGVLKKLAKLAFQLPYL